MPWPSLNANDADPPTGTGVARSAPAAQDNTVTAITASNPFRIGKLLESRKEQQVSPSARDLMSAA
jgi:hypothetical protein